MAMMTSDQIDHLHVLRDVHVHVPQVHVAIPKLFGANPPLSTDEVVEFRGASFF